MSTTDTTHRKILARVCARNDRKMAVVQTTEPKWPYFIMRPQSPGADVPDCFEASFKNPEERVAALPGNNTVGVSILAWSHDKRQALSYLRE